MTKRIGFMESGRRPMAMRLPCPIYAHRPIPNGNAQIRMSFGILSILVISEISRWSIYFETFSQNAILFGSATLEP